MASNIMVRTSSVTGKMLVFDSVSADLIPVLQGVYLRDLGDIDQGALPHRCTSLL